MKQAILAAEDERFYQHGGVDYFERAARGRLPTSPAARQQGASTITMQVARNFFLTREKTLTRKLNEALLAFKIEASLTKDQILELYVNQIFLGQRAYGFAAAAQIYFGKPLEGRHRRRGGDARRAAEGAVALQPGRQSASAPRCASCTCCAGCTTSTTSTDAQFAEAQTAPLAVRQGLREVVAVARRVRRRDGAPGRSSSATATTPTPGAHASTPRSARPTRTPPTPRCGAACIDYDRRHGYRGPEALRRAAGRQRRAGAGARARCSRTTPNSDDMLAGGRARGHADARSRPCCADGETVADHRRRPQVRRPRRSATRRRRPRASAAAR